MPAGCVIVRDNTVFGGWGGICLQGAVHQVLLAGNRMLDLETRAF
jgi:parallel beta-helix repeat protein